MTETTTVGLEAHTTTDVPDSDKRSYAAAPDFPSGHAPETSTDERATCERCGTRPAVGLDAETGQNLCWECANNNGPRLVADGGVTAPSVPTAVSREEFFTAGELPKWEGPSAELDRHGEPTGDYYVACSDCEREVLVDERSNLTHAPDCEEADDE
ncbi:hypothetical protein [Halocalculus aciditolerans]|uniref:DUF8118 domain-containing protein n=1 Tax=Halocalculus aciditolerans TaxID=1383812 RepID=A0A830FBH9_9EURY|nr:hypothetical protein [Halocalculus aciditolerans]GGL58034.1 hypothetical protein GCM10009039_15300 [Halocalculus aciditolerans]